MARNRPLTITEVINSLELIDIADLDSVQGGQLPPGIDEAMAEGERAAQHPKSKLLLE